MRTIIAGSRGFDDYHLLQVTVDRIGSGMAIAVVLSGHASRGADVLGERYAKEHGIPLELYPADWDTYGRSAGMVRNLEMAVRADALIAFNMGTPGTNHIVSKMRGDGKIVFEIAVGPRRVGQTCLPI